MNRGMFISVHIADLHFAAFDPARQYRILKEQFINNIVQLPRLDLISVNGDIFDHKLMGNSDSIYYASILIDELVNIAREKNATLLLLHGTYSHDADQLKLFYHYMDDPTVDVRVVTQIKFEQIKNCRVLCIPELYGISDEYYDEVLHYSGYYDLAVIHDEVPQSVQEHYNNLTYDATECIACGECEDRCPFNVKIVDIMLDAQDLLN